jgi:oxygen-independent coproporphyrinogen-3 oxidase
MLGAAGYLHYEISNWARAGGEAAWQSPRLAAAHNLIYWRNQPYLGLGAGAYSTVNGERWMNVKRPQTYLERVEIGTGLGLARAEKSVERIDRSIAIQEQLLLGLRLVREGVGLAEFEARFGVALPDAFPDAFPEAVADGLASNLTELIETPPDGRRLRLTEQGRFLANQVIIQFIQ